MTPIFMHTKMLSSGASNSAIDAALESIERCKEVTLISSRKRSRSNVLNILGSPDMINRIKEGSIKVITTSLITDK